ncbi:preprotein translocase subunit SecA [Patescibacteria group bacterium]|nr:preprotein translocase subunit SecA [Patescibacteria group bacterium]
MSFISKYFKNPNEKELDNLNPMVEEINALESDFAKLSNKELLAKTNQLKEKLKAGQSLDSILPFAFALVRQASKKTLDQRHYNVQLVGGIALHQGKVIEMKTGEGKTLAATLAVFLNALAGKGVHVITVNDYLSKRDVIWMGQIYHALGMSVSCIVHESAFIYDPLYLKEENDLDRDKQRDEMGGFKIEESYLRPVSRKQAYLADITYGTNNEFGFDYLRDNLVQAESELSQRELNYAVIDEVDSILIDEARTPLIISAKAEESADLYQKLSILIKALTSGKEYVVDEELRAVTLTEQGMNKLSETLGKDPWENNDFNLIHHIDVALKAMVLFQKDRDYVIKKGEIIIVDEFTGRLMVGRRYSEGLHQAIEAKEGVSIKEESKTLATVSFQNYFRYYKKLAGMTGTALTEAEEFDKIYKLEVLAVPTHKQRKRDDLADVIYRTNQAKLAAVIQDVKERNKQGQPILIGTGGFAIGEKTVGAIEKNRIIKDMLTKEGISANVLDATNHKKEGEIIAQAGRVGAVTVATNMAGRGVDIVLGGNPIEPDAQQKVIELGGLHIIGTERHEARRIDNQLRGRAGRQGDPGSSQFFISLEDDLMRIFGGSRLAGLMEGLKMPVDMPIESKLVSKSIESAQKKVEGFNFDTRKHLLEYDDVLNKHRETIYSKRKLILKMKHDEIKSAILKIVKTEIGIIVNGHFPKQNNYIEETKLNDFIQQTNIAINSIFRTENNIINELKSICKSILGNTRQISIKKTIQTKEKIIEYLSTQAMEAFNNLEENIKASLKDKQEEIMTKIWRSLWLQNIDRSWINHLEIIDNLKGGIGLRAYGQRDPLIEYKGESFKKFNQLLKEIDKQIVYSVYKIGPTAKVHSASIKELNLQGAPKTTVKKQIEFKRQTGTKIGRNDICLCGSGKKYKKCCYPKYD